jgi:RNA polymerase sigma factor (TIGR02999 family)
VPKRGAGVNEFTQLLLLAKDGDQSAWQQAVDLVYQDLRRIARRVTGGNQGNTLNPTALVHECYLRLASEGPPGVVDRTHFLALAARAMRQLMLNHARDRVAAKRGGGAAHTELGEHADTLVTEASSLLELEEALTRLEALDPRWVQVIECRIFAGLSEQETADAMGIPLRSAQRLWQEARERLQGLLDAS